MRTSTSGSQALRGFKKAAVFGAIGVAAVAVAFRATGPDGAIIAALMLTFRYCGKPVLLPPCFILIGRGVIEGLKFLTRHTPTTHDAMLWQLDGLLGFEPSVAAMAIVSTVPGLWEGLVIAYHQGLLVAMALVAAAAPSPWRFLVKVVVASAFGYALFWIVPACGPGFFLYGPADAPRNAMPSMHMVWAFMVRGEVGRRGVGPRLAADIFIILTVLSTLGLGEHYLVDLLAAVPFWLAFEALWRWRRIRALARLESVGENSDILPQERGSI